MAMAIGAVLGAGVLHAGAAAVSETMHKLAADVRELLPIIYRYEQAEVPVDGKRVNDKIDTMLAHAEEIATSTPDRGDTWQISSDLLVNQLQQARDEFSQGREAHGMSLLRSATSVCVTCHTQDDRTAGWLMPAGESLGDGFVAGEFLFMTRQYERAFEVYRHWLRSQETLPYENRTLTAFGRLLLTALQMRKSADDIGELLAEFAERESVNLALRKDLNDWIAGIRELQTHTDISSHPDPETLRSLALQWLSDGDREAGGPIFITERQRPAIIWLRGELYRALTQEADRDRVADWLYWLALGDRVLEYRFYYSLADMYLKQCMLEYTDNPVAPLCYREYENYVEFFYSGSGGTHVPADIEAELDMLRSRVWAEH